MLIVYQDMNMFTMKTLIKQDYALEQPSILIKDIIMLGGDSETSVLNKKNLTKQLSIFKMQFP